MGRAPCCDKANVKRGPWSPQEDEKLKAYIEEHGTGGNWIALPQKIGLKRCGKSCRLRWLNYLRPNIKHGGFSEEEDNIICGLYMAIGSRWSIIAAQLPGRTDNDIKNYWNTRLKKKLILQQRKAVAAALSPVAATHIQINNQTLQQNHQAPYHHLPTADSDHIMISAQQHHHHQINHQHHLEVDHHDYLRFLSTQHEDHLHHQQLPNNYYPPASTSSSTQFIQQDDQYHMSTASVEDYSGLLTATMNNNSVQMTQLPPDHQEMPYFENINGAASCLEIPQSDDMINYFPVYDQPLYNHDASLYNTNFHGFVEGMNSASTTADYLGGNASSSSTSASAEGTTSLGPDHMSPVNAYDQSHHQISNFDACQQSVLMQLQQGGFIVESEYSSSNLVV